MTFPINATHSDMVKFARDSHYCHTVVSKLASILLSSPNVNFAAGNFVQAESRNMRTTSEPDSISGYRAASGISALAMSGGPLVRIDLTCE